MARRKRSRTPGSGKPPRPFVAGSPEPLPFPGLSPDDARLADDEEQDLDPQEAMRVIDELRAQNPDLLEQMLGEFKKWHDDFAREHGRDPDLADINSVFAGEFNDADLADLDDVLDEPEEALDALESVGEAVAALSHRCAWCEAAIPDEASHFALGVRCTTEIDFESYREKPFEIALTDGRRLLAWVPAPGAQARQDGYQLLLAFCSEDCAAAARVAIDREIKFGTAMLLN